jgi:hypothetical protein
MGKWKVLQTDYDELKLAVDDAVYDIESLLALIDLNVAEMDAVAWRLKQVVRRLKDD